MSFGMIIFIGFIGIVNAQELNVCNSGSCIWTNPPKSQILVCGQNAGSCLVNCNSFNVNGQCQGLIIYNLSPSLQVNCDYFNSCKNIKIYCGPFEPPNIQSQGLTSNDFNTATVNLCRLYSNTNFFNVGQYAQIYCSGDVKDCYAQSQNRGMNDIILYCIGITNMNSQCYALCQTSNGCNNGTIYCVSSPDTNCYKTGIGSNNIQIRNIISDSPTKYPTTTPTQNPTNTPSISPTKSPLTIPTMTPILIPTISQNTIPSVTATLIPSMIPSKTPTLQIIFNRTESTTVSPNNITSPIPIDSSTQPKPKNKNPKIWLIIIMLMLFLSLIAVLFGILLHIRKKQKQSSRSVKFNASSVISESNNNGLNDIITPGNKANYQESNMERISYYLDKRKTSQIRDSSAVLNNNQKGITEGIPNKNNNIIDNSVLNIESGNDTNEGNHETHINKEGNEQEMMREFESNKDKM